MYYRNRSAARLPDFKAMIRQGEFLVLDTETTGLGRAEICQLAVIDAQGAVLIDTLVKPVGRIPSDATRIHGITNLAVTDAPRWGEVAPQLETLLKGRDTIIYNAAFDRKMLHNSNEAAQLPRVEWEAVARFWCAMEAFSEVYGGRYGSSRWHKLTAAASYYQVPAANAHNALGDCRMTLAVVKKMAES